jgi:hypothetical protein
MTDADRALVPASPNAACAETMVSVSYTPQISVVVGRAVLKSVLSGGVMVSVNSTPPMSVARTWHALKTAQLDAPTVNAGFTALTSADSFNYQEAGCVP